MKKLLYWVGLLGCLIIGWLWGGELLSPAQLIAQPYQYDGLEVTVRGKVGKTEVLELKRGGAPPIIITLIELKGEKDEYITASALGSFKVKPGSPLVFSGIFYAGVKLGDKRIENLVLEGINSCQHLKKMVCAETQTETPSAPGTPAPKEIVVLTPEQIITSPDAYDRQTVMIKADVRQLQSDVAIGKYVFKKFNLEGGSKITLQAMAANTLMANEGESVVAAGTFYKNYHVDGSSDTFTNTVEVAALKTMEEIKAMVAAEEAKASGKTAPKPGETSGKNTQSPSPSPSPTPAPAPPPVVAPPPEKIDGVIALGKVSDCKEIDMMGSPNPLLELRLNGLEPIQVLALDKNRPNSGSLVRVIGVYQTKFTMTKPNLSEVIVASKVETLNEQDYKKIAIPGTFFKTTGKISEVKSISWEGKKALYLMLESRGNTDYPVFFKNQADYSAGDKLMVIGKFEKIERYIKNPPLLQHPGAFPAHWEKGIYPKYVLVVEYAEKLK